MQGLSQALSCVSPSSYVGTVLAVLAFVCLGALGSGGVAGPPVQWKAGAAAAAAGRGGAPEDPLQQSHLDNAKFLLAALHVFLRMLQSLRGFAGPPARQFVLPSGFDKALFFLMPLWCLIAGAESPRKPPTREVLARHLMLLVVYSKVVFPLFHLAFWIIDIPCGHKPSFTWFLQALPAWLFLTNAHRCRWLRGIFCIAASTIVTGFVDRSLFFRWPLRSLGYLPFFILGQCLDLECLQHLGRPSRLRPAACALLAFFVWFCCAWESGLERLLEPWTCAVQSYPFHFAGCVHLMPCFADYLFLWSRVAMDFFLWGFTGLCFFLFCVPRRPTCFTGRGANALYVILLHDPVYQLALHCFSQHRAWPPILGVRGSEQLLLVAALAVLALLAAVALASKPCRGLLSWALETDWPLPCAGESAPPTFILLFAAIPGVAVADALGQSSGDVLCLMALLMCPHLDRSLAQSQLPWTDWRLPNYTSEERTDSVVGNANSVESVVGRGPALPEVRFLYYLEQGRLLVVLDAPDNAPNDAPETLGMLVDLETGKVRGVDMYGHGPPGRSSKPRLMGLPDGDEEVEGRWGSVHGTDTVGGTERLVVAQVIEQRLHEQPQEGPQSILVLLYESNRLAVMTLRSFELHTQIMEEMSYDRRIGDMPLAATALPNPRSGAFHVVVSYASSVVRWWTVSLHQCRLQSHQLMSAPISQLAVCRWSSTPVHSSTEPVKASLVEAAAAPAPPQRKEAGVTPTGRSSYGGSRQVSQLELLGSPKAARSPSLAGSRLESPWPLSPRSPRRLTMPKSQSTTDGGLLTRPRPSLCLPRLSRDLGVGAGLSLGPSVITMSGSALLEAGPYSVTPRSSRFGGATSTVPGNSPQAVYLPDLEADFGFHQMSLLLVAADTTGHLTFYILQNGKITKVYSCPDLCPHGASRHKLNQLACSERGVLVLWSNGDLRQVEFTLCEKVVNVLDIPFEV